jgi:hypothetical protein
VEGGSGVGEVVRITHRQKFFKKAILGAKLGSRSFTLFLEPSLATKFLRGTNAKSFPGHRVYGSVSKY